MTRRLKLILPPKPPVAAEGESEAGPGWRSRGCAFPHLFLATSAQADRDRRRRWIHCFRQRDHCRATASGDFRERRNLNRVHEYSRPPTINDSKTTTIELICGSSSTRASDRNVIVGDYAFARIDLDDVDAVGFESSHSPGGLTPPERAMRNREIGRSDTPMPRDVLGALQRTIRPKGDTCAPQSVHATVAQPGGAPNAGTLRLSDAGESEAHHAESEAAPQ